MAVKLPARHPRLFQLNATAVASTLLFVSVAWASADTSAPAKRRDAIRQPEGIASPAVKVNPSRPLASPPAALPAFSDQPSDAEIFQARLFAEPLVPIAGKTSPQENRALVEALQAYANAGRTEAVEPLLDFLDRHPASAWRVALLSDLGSLYRRAGSFTRALDAWEEAWRLGNGETERRGKAIVDGALAQFAELNARLGRYQRLDELFREIQGRPIGGSAGEIMVRVREGRWLMEHDPGFSFRCGPYALEHIFAFGHPGAGTNRHLGQARSSKQGTSLLQMRDLARVAGLNLGMARRSGDVAIPLPAMVHWKSGHFAALLESSGERYRAEDATFDGSFWVSREVLNDEASGYFLLPGTNLSPGWEPVEEVEAAQVWGKGVAQFIEPQTPDEPENCPSCSGGNCRQPMAAYSFQLLNVGLRVFDTPVGYDPPFGPAVRFEVDYNQRDSFQPAIFTYSNLGPKWTFNWLSYVEDNPAFLQADVSLYARGGGRSTYTSMGAGVSTSAVNARNQSVLARTATSPIRYERRLADGSVEVFAAVLSGSPRKVFMTQLIDPMGNTLTLGYDLGMRLVSVTDSIFQVTTLHYDLPADSYKITSVVDPFGRTASFQYDSNLRLRQIVDVIAIASTFTYDDPIAPDFVKSLQTSYGTTTFTTGFTESIYSLLGRWLEAVDPLGAKERVEFLQDGNIGIPSSDPIAPQGLPADNPIENTWLWTRNTFYWNKRAYPLPEDSPSVRYGKAHIYHWLHGVHPTFTYGAAAVLESEKATVESRIWYTYPGKPEDHTPHNEWKMDRPTAVARVLDDPDGSGPGTGPTQIYRYEYNSRGKVCRAIDPLLRETRFTYGTNNVPDASCTAGSSIDLLKVEQKNGAVWDVLETRTYNDKHEPLTVTDPSGKTTTYTYNARGQIWTVVTPARAGITENRTTTYSCDGSGYPQSIQGPGGDTTSFTYDTYGRVRTMTPNDGDVLTYDYDALDRVTRITFPDLSYEESTYVNLDLVRQRDRLGRVTRRVYDELRRVKEVHEDDEVSPGGGTGLNRTTTYVWCSCGSLDKVIDPNGNETTWDRDLQGRVFRETRDDGQFWEYTYETTTSRLKERKDPRLQVTSYQYFLDDKLQQRSYSNTQVATPAVSFTYDSNYGRLATMTDTSGTGVVTSYSYYPVAVPPSLGAGRLQSVDGPLTSDLVAYTYDELGRIKTRGLSAAPISFTYDQLGRVAIVGSSLGNFTYGFSGSSIRPVSLGYPNGQVTQYDSFISDPRRGIKYNSITHRAPGGAVLLRFDGYAYDLESDIMNYSYHLGTPGVVPTKTFEPAYDGLDQLTQAPFTTDPGPPTVVYDYSYDLAGNRTLDGMATSTYNNRNELTSRQGVTYTHDANGNLVSHTASGSEPARTFEWDAENRLVRIVAGTTQQASFKYDGLGRRVQKVASGVTHDYVYDEERMAEERIGTMTPSRYIDGPGVDQHLARRAGNAWRYYMLTDHLGNIYRETGSTGTVTLTREYDPYGNLLQGANASGHAYTGREWDAETGLYYYRARYYDPKVGRFISEDPIGFDGGINFYAYVENTPVNRTDPFGLQLGGPNCKIGPAPPTPAPSPTPPPCLTESPCPCGTHEEFRWNLFWPCFFGGGNVTTVGTAAQAGGGTPQTGMWGAAVKGGWPTATNPKAPNNPGPAAGGAAAAVTATGNFCHKAATLCVKD